MNPLQIIQGITISGGTFLSLMISQIFPLPPESIPYTQESSTITQTGWEEEIKQLKQNQEYFVAEGSYYNSYIDQTASYTLYIPKDGGEIRGFIKGFCRGKLNGNFDKQMNTIKGSGFGKYTIHSIRGDINIAFLGKLNYEENKVELIVNSDNPMLHDLPIAISFKSI